MSRDIKLLYPKLQIIIKELINKCLEVGIIIQVLDTYRNEQEQNSIPLTNTNAKYPTSMHNWGVAFDFCIIENRKVNWNTPLYSKVGQIGKALGLMWGGDFTTIKGDYGHFHLKEFGYQPKDILIPKYKTPETFMKTWNKEEYKMKPEDANKIIAVLGAFYNLIVAQEDKNEIHRLADELRKASGQQIS